MRGVLWPSFLALSFLAPAVSEPPNLASPSLGAVVSGPRNASGSADKPPAANDGLVTDYGPNHGYAWGWFEEPLAVTFPRATVVNKVEVLLLDVDARAYDFRLEVGDADGRWKTAAERTRASGWVALSFPPVTCMRLRLVFTGGTLEVRSYHVVEIAAYNAPGPEAVPPSGRRGWPRGRPGPAATWLCWVGMRP